MIKTSESKGMIFQLYYPRCRFRQACRSTEKEKTDARTQENSPFSCSPWLTASLLIHHPLSKHHISPIRTILNRKSYSPSIATVPQLSRHCCFRRSDKNNTIKFLCCQLTDESSLSHWRAIRTLGCWSSSPAAFVWRYYELFHAVVSLDMLLDAAAAVL